jgi:hypothetical protein
LRNTIKRIPWLLRVGPREAKAFLSPTWGSEVWIKVALALARGLEEAIPLDQLSLYLGLQGDVLEDIDVPRAPFLFGDLGPGDLEDLGLPLEGYRQIKGVHFLMAPFFLQEHETQLRVVGE